MALKCTPTVVSLALNIPAQQAIWMGATNWVDSNPHSKCISSPKAHCGPSEVFRSLKHFPSSLTPFTLPSDQRIAVLLSKCPSGDVYFLQMGGALMSHGNSGSMRKEGQGQTAPGATGMEILFPGSYLPGAAVSPDEQHGGRSSLEPERTS